MLSNMASSLIKHKRIRTTLAKAKALRQYIEPLVTRSKEDTTHSRRMVFRYLQDKNAITELFGDIAGRIAERPGGYTRILKIAENRAGDNAEMCYIEFVDYNETYNEETKTKSRRRRRRRGGKSDASTATPAPAEAPEVEETTTEEPVAEAVEEQPVVEVSEETPTAETTEEEPAAEEGGEKKEG